MSLASRLDRLEARRREVEAVADVILALPCKDGDGHPPGSWELRWPDANGRWHQRIIGPDERCQYPGADFTDHGDPELYLEAYLRQRERPGGFRDAELDGICKSWGWPTVEAMEAKRAKDAVYQERARVAGWQV